MPDNGVATWSFSLPEEPILISPVVIGRSSVWTLMAGATLWMSLSGAACGGDCSPIQHDDVFPLDLQRDPSMLVDAAPDGSVAADASASFDAVKTSDGAAPDDGRPNAGMVPDGGAPPFRLSCGSLAEGCTPGQPCPPACDCVLARQRMVMDPMTIIDQCILFSGTGPPSVEVRSRLVVHCS